MNYQRAELTAHQRKAAEDRRAEIYARLAEVDPYEPTQAQRMEQADLRRELGTISAQLLTPDQRRTIAVTLGSALWEAFQQRYRLSGSCWVNLDILNQSIRYHPVENPDGIYLDAHSVVTVLGPDILAYIDHLQNNSVGSSRFYLHSNLNSLQLQDKTARTEEKRRRLNKAGLDPQVRKNLEQQYREEDAAAEAYHAIWFAQRDAERAKGQERIEELRRQQEAEKTLYFDTHLPADYIRDLDRATQIKITRLLSDCLLEKWHRTGLKAALSQLGGGRTTPAQKASFYELEQQVRSLKNSALFPAKAFSGGTILLRLSDYLLILEQEIVATCFLKIAEQNTRPSYMIGVRLVIDEQECLAWLETKLFKNQAEYERRSVADWPCDYRLSE